MEEVSMTEYEKAMLLFQMQQSEYLHIIASNREPARAGKTAERFAAAFGAQCPTVIEFLRSTVKSTGL